VLERLIQFDGPPEQFIASLLAMQCQLAGAQSGAICRQGGQGPQILSVYPQLRQGQSRPEWLGRGLELAGEVFRLNAAVIRPIHSGEDLYGQPPRRHVVAVPVHRQGQTPGAGVFLLDTSDPDALEDSRKRLELTSILLQMYELRLTLQRREVDFKRMRTSLEVLNTVNARGRFLSAAMALCNDICSRWSCYRVSLGLPKGRYIRVRAMSETEKFDRKSEDLQKLEAAMEEAYDQDLEIVYPAGQEAMYIHRAAGELGAFKRQSAVVSLPLRQEGQVVGVVTAERDLERPFGQEEIESLRLACELSAPRVLDLARTDQWFGARAASSVREAASKVLSPQHTWLKLLAIGIFAFFAFLVFARGDYTAEGTFVVEPRNAKVITAPFAGKLLQARVRPGDAVRAGQTVLARMQVSHLQADLAEAEAKQKEYENLRQQAAFEGKNGEAERYGLLAKAQSAIVQQKREDLAGLSGPEGDELRSPIDGEVLEGDWWRHQNMEVEAGQELFVVAPRDDLRAELLIEETDIAGVEVGDTGQLVATGRADLRVPFTVEWISPIAKVVGQRNVFSVRVRLDEKPSWLKPGMEGVGKVLLGRRSYGWLWTRDVVNWVRMKLWW
jgi:multidrug efflux pump subunit AcrA (membrane-fusion protein)